MKPFILEDVMAHARAVLEEARIKAAAEAELLLSQARAEAERLRAEAQRQGREAGQATGLAEGREKGLAEGRREAIEKVGPPWETARQAIEKAAVRIESSLAEVTTKADEKVLQLAFRIGTVVLKREISIDPAAFRGNLQAALKAAARTGRFRVRLNPEDLAILQTGFEEFKPLLPDGEIFEWVGDEAVEKGGAIVETGAGDVDATIKTQLSQIEQIVLGRSGGGR